VSSVRNIFIKVVQFRVRPNDWVQKLARILTNLKPAFQSEFIKLFRVCQKAIKITGDSLACSNLFPLFPQ